MNGVIYVVAGSLGEARLWAAAQKLSPRQWQYVSEAVQLRGLHKADIRTIGTWRAGHRHELEHLEEAICYHGRKAPR